MFLSKDVFNDRKQGEIEEKKGYKIIQEYAYMNMH